MLSNKQFVVYTCITGNYDSLREVRYLSPNIDYICFTDNPQLQSKTWKVLPLPDEIKNSSLSNVKKQRLIKVQPHKWLSDYTVSLWIDSNIEIIGDLSDFFLKYDLKNKFLYTNKHPSRDCIYREQLAILQLEKDTFENTNTQISRYHDEEYPEHNGLAETNIMLRLHGNPRCVKAMDMWADEIVNGSHRDQLSFNYCIWKCGVENRIAYLDEKYFNLHLCDNAYFKLTSHRSIKLNPNSTVIVDVSNKESVVSEEKKEKERAKEAIVQPIKQIDKSFPVVSVVVFTHNRTNVATETLKSLFKNLKYSGKLKWILSDDRSTNEHLAAMNDVFRENHMDYELVSTDKEHWGLGASMNNGLRKAFGYGETALRVEDDWILERELNLDKLVRTLQENANVAGIRLGMIGGGVDSDDRLFNNKWFKVLVGPNDSAWLFNNQVMLVNKRIHRVMGWYLENVDADTSEEEFRTRFNRNTGNGRRKLLLLTPSEMKWRTFDDPSLWFIHVGRSTLGHKVYKEPKRYGWIYGEEKKERIEEVKTPLKKECFDVIVSLTTYKPRLQKKHLEKVLRSILNQKTKHRIKIVLTLYKNDQKHVSDNLKKFLNEHNVEILVVSDNLRPHLKYFYTMLKYRMCPIITIDDDCIYEDTLVEDLYNSYLKYPKCVSAKRVHQITYDDYGIAKEYKKWVFECKNVNEPSFDLCATGVGGVLYPPDILRLSGDNLDVIKLSLTNDDLYLRRRETELGIRVKYVEPKNKVRSYTLLDEAISDHALCQSDNKEGNDKLIKLLNFCNIYQDINVAYIMDNDYTQPTLASINSLKKNRNPENNYNVYVICDNVSESNQCKLKSFSEKNFSIRILKNPNIGIDKSKIRTVNSVSRSAIYKFFLSDILKGLNKVLYIDGDTIILKDLEELYSLDIDGYYVGAVKDFKVNCKYIQPFYRNMVKKLNGYFNSGVMLLNLNLMRKNKLSKQLLEYRMREINFFMDQDALNVKFNAHVRWIDPKYNFIASNMLWPKDEVCKFYGKEDLPNVIDDLKNSDIVVFHMTGIDKPWKNSKNFQLNDFWKKYAY